MAQCHSTTIGLNIKKFVAIDSESYTSHDLMHPMDSYVMCGTIMGVGSKSNAHDLLEFIFMQ